jgi:hypothetical protein
MGTYRYINTVAHIQDVLITTFPHLQFYLGPSQYHNGYELKVKFSEDHIARMIISFSKLEFATDMAVKDCIDFIHNIDSEYNSKLGKLLRGVE